MCVLSNDSFMMGPAWQVIVGYYYGSLSPPHTRGKGLGILEHFLGLACHHMITHAPI